MRYSYGAAGAANRTVGRISRIEDATGEIEYQYGLLGEITQADRTIRYDNIGPFQSSRSYRTQWEYDTWNRLKTMTYPDGERLIYDYDLGGKLKQIRGVKGLEAESKSHYGYLDKLTYDKFGQRVYQKYGNGTETTYQYEADRRRLSQMQVVSPAASYQRRLGRSHQFIDNHYDYDRNGNVTQLDNRAQAASFIAGGSIQQTFSYDNLNQLLSASGNYLPGNNRQERYTLTHQYDEISNITNKTQSHDISGFANRWQEQRGTSYDYAYDYMGTPHAPSKIGNRTYSHDANGNQTGYELPATFFGLIQERRVLDWDEENRLKSVANNKRGLFSDEYVYDHAGERTIKRDGLSVVSYINAHSTINNTNQLTKHIFAGSERIVTKVAGEVSQTLIDPQRGTDAYHGNAEMFSKSASFYRFRYREETQRYFYHPDHLGSTTYVTDADGEISEHVAYLPSGETWTDDSSFGFSVPYKFTSKELDASTGLYYFGARYYDPRTSVWQSADPILGSYLDGAVNGGVFNPGNLNLYSYSLNNPVTMLDPDGQSPVSVVLKYAAKQGVKKAIQRQGKSIANRRFKKYMTDKQYAEFIGELTDIVDSLNGSGWETAVELVPVVGDIYGAGKGAKQVKEAYNRLQDLENKYVGKIASSLSIKERQKFLDKMRSRGVADSKKDHEFVGNPYKKGEQGHHRNNVADHNSLSTDPRYIEPLDRAEHLKKHRGDFRNKTTGDILDMYK